jgi:UDP-N-acetylmuramoylalanine--D-glutamate ligase
VRNKLVILGSGRSGIGAAELAVLKDWDVLVSDSGSLSEDSKRLLNHLHVDWEEGRHSDLVLNADLVIKSPGIPEQAEVIVKCRERSIPVISEIEFAGRYTEGKIIGVTGTNGKTTTCHLIAHILRRAGLDVALAGNVGNSFAGELASSDHDWWVLELSSFQLDDIDEFRPHIAVLLNITPDHLDRYSSLKAYAEAKMRITENQDHTDHFIYKGDDKIVAELLEETQVRAQKWSMTDHKTSDNGAWMSEGEIHVKTQNNYINMSIYDLALSGKHNAYNSMASALASTLVGIRKEVIKESLSDFEAVEHRLEHVLNVHGVEYINDSKATNVNATWYALESMTRPVIWICGGVDKGNDYEQIKPLLKGRVKAIIALGKDNQKIIQAFQQDLEVIVEAETMESAVKTAYNLGEKGDVVLLSPACASFDLFENFEDRGRQFKKSVYRL